MADKPKKKMPEGRRIQKGQVLNPAGRPKLPTEIREAQKLTRTEFERLLQKFIWMPKDKLEEFYGNPEILMIDAMIASIIMRAVNDGCTVRLNFLLDRLIGKSKFNDGDDATTNVQIEKPVSFAGPTFIVEMNENGKFVRARPRELLIDDSKKVSNE